MGFLDGAGDFLDRGMSAARGAVSSVAGEQLPFVRKMAQLCTNGYRLGYHERNGGNASYRLTYDDLDAVRPFFYDNPSSWVDLGVRVPSMGGSHILTTASGGHLRNVERDCVENLGIVELSPTGESWRVVWGFKGGARPTSELGAHVRAHAVRMQATGGSCRVCYHAHPNALVALTALVPADSRTITRLLWSSLTESIIAIPGGIAMIGWEVPGSVQLATRTAEALADFDACIWQLHGVFATADTCDGALGLVEAVDKAADVYLRARTAQGGKPELPFTIGDAGLRATAQAYGLPINESFLG